MKNKPHPRSDFSLRRLGTIKKEKSSGCVTANTKTQGVKALAPHQEALKQSIESARLAIEEAQSRLWQLERSCSHVVVGAENEEAKCAVCDQEFGWWCPRSPNHVCKYSTDFDSCDYCGSPEERK